MGGPARREAGQTCQYKNGGKTYTIQEGEVTEIKKTKVETVAKFNMLRFLKYLDIILETGEGV